MAVTAATFLAFLTGATAFGARDLFVEVNGLNARFDLGGPARVRLHQVVTIDIQDDDPRRVWSVTVDYRKPVEDGLASSVATVAGMVGDYEGAPHEDKDKVLEALSEKTDAAREALSYYLQASDAQQAKATLDQLRKDLRDSLQDALGVLTSHELQHLRAVQESQQVLHAVNEALAWAARAAASRRERVRVRRSGYEEVAFTACRQTLQMKQGKMQVTEPVCSEQPYVMQIVDPTGPVVLTASLAIPVQIGTRREYFLDPSAEDDEDPLTFTERRQVDAVPLITLGVRHTFPEPVAPHVGWDIGLGVGDQFGELFTTGVTFGVSGISLGAGPFLDLASNQRALRRVSTGSLEERTEGVPSGGVYVRLGLTSDLWRMVARAARPPAPATTEGASDKADSVNVPAP